MTLYNELYKEVRADRQTDNGALEKLYTEHRASKFVREEKKEEECKWG